MKSLLITFIAIFTLTGAMAQTGGSVPYDKEKKAIIYTDVVETPGMSKGLLYDRAVMTLNEIYERAANKMLVNDKEKGEITMRCTIRVMLPDPKTGKVYQDNEYIQYKLTLQFKDGRYRYEFHDFHMDRGYHYPLENFYTKHQTVKEEDRADEKLAYVDKEIKDIIAKLKKGMVDARVEKKEDW